MERNGGRLRGHLFKKKLTWEHLVFITFKIWRYTVHIGSWIFDHVGAVRGNNKGMNILSHETTIRSHQNVHSSSLAETPFTCGEGRTDNASALIKWKQQNQKMWLMLHAVLSRHQVYSLICRLLPLVLGMRRRFFSRCSSSGVPSHTLHFLVLLTFPLYKFTEISLSACWHSEVIFKSEE